MPETVVTVSYLIAGMLFISVRTAEAHRARIMQKLELDSRADLVRYAMENGLTER